MNGDQTSSLYYRRSSAADTSRFCHGASPERDPGASIIRTSIGRIRGRDRQGGFQDKGVPRGPQVGIADWPSRGSQIESQGCSRGASVPRQRIPVLIFRTPEGKRIDLDHFDAFLFGRTRRAPDFPGSGFMTFGTSSRRCRSPRARARNMFATRWATAYPATGDVYGKEKRVWQQFGSKTRKTRQKDGVAGRRRLISLSLVCGTKGEGSLVVGKI